jgi:hypothetical protein
MKPSVTYFYFACYFMSLALELRDRSVQPVQPLRIVSLRLAVCILTVSVLICVQLFAVFVSAGCTL